MSSPADRLSAVLDRFERPLLGYAMVRCGDHGLAQDAVQETLRRPTICRLPHCLGGKGTSPCVPS